MSPLGAIISVGGPPHSGKSVFLNALDTELVRLFGDRVFLERANPDGEGHWTMEVPKEVRDAIRTKAPFTSGFVNQKLEGVPILGQTKHIVLVDLGGKLADDISMFLSLSTHAIILSRDGEALSDWCGAVKAAGSCTLLGRLTSTHHRLPSGALDPDTRSTIDLSDPLPWTGDIRNLDRDGTNVPYIEVVRAMAEKLGAMFIGS